MLYGTVLTAVGVAVESGLVCHGAHADLTALRWHASLWDPWFLLWGLLLMTGLVLSHPHTAPTTAIPPMYHDEPLVQAAGMPSVFGHGMFSRGFLCTALAGWAGPGHVTRVGLRFSKQTWPGETLVTRVVVTGKREEGDPLFTRVVPEELRYEPRRRHPRRQSLARLIEPGAKPVALLVGSLLQAAEIDRHRLRVPEQAGECRRAERSIRVARSGGILDSPEQPVVRLQGGDLDVGRAVDPLGESSHRPDERTGHRRRNGPQRLQGGVDCPGPLGEVCLPRPPALRLGGVLAVVAGQVQVLDVGKRVPLQDPGLGLGVGGPRRSRAALRPPGTAAAIR
jgi:hypothetical protein